MIQVLHAPVHVPLGRTIVDIQGAVMPSMSHPISASTIGRRLHDAELHAHRPLRRLPLTQLQCQ